LAPLSLGRKFIRWKTNFKITYNVDGLVPCKAKKARVIYEGYMQKEGIDYYKLDFCCSSKDDMNL